VKRSGSAVLAGNLFFEGPSLTTCDSFRVSLV
jgi:hypothetical protein